MATSSIDSQASCFSALGLMTVARIGVGLEKVACCSLFYWDLHSPLSRNALSILTGRVLNREDDTPTVSLRCSVMSEVRDASIQLIVTSPPYPMIWDDVRP